MRYFIYRDSEILGPYSADEADQWRGVGADALVCPEGADGGREDDWIGLANVPELSGILNQAVDVESVLSPTAVAELPDFAGLIPPDFDDPTASLGAEAFVPPEAKAQLIDWVARYKETIESDRVHSSELEARIADLNNQLSTYESRQNDILDRLRQKDLAVEEKSQSLRERDRLIDQLRGQLSQQEMRQNDIIGRLHDSERRMEAKLDALREKDRLLDELREQLVRSTELYAARAAEPPAAHADPDVLREKDKLLGEMRAQLARSTELLASRPPVPQAEPAVLREKDRLLDELRAQLARTTELLASRPSAAPPPEIEPALLREKDRMVDELRAQLARTTELLATRSPAPPPHEIESSALREKDRLLDELRAQLVRTTELLARRSVEPRPAPPLIEERLAPAPPVSEAPALPALPSLSPATPSFASFRPPAPPEPTSPAESPASQRPPDAESAAPVEPPAAGAPAVPETSGAPTAPAEVAGSPVAEVQIRSSPPPTAELGAAEPLKPAFTAPKFKTFVPPSPPAPSAQAPAPAVGATEAPALQDISASTPPVPGASEPPAIDASPAEAAPPIALHSESLEAPPPAGPLLFTGVSMAPQEPAAPPPAPVQPPAPTSSGFEPPAAFTDLAADSAQPPLTIVMNVPAGGTPPGIVLPGAPTPAPRSSDAPSGFTPFPSQTTPPGAAAGGFTFPQSTPVPGGAQSGVPADPLGSMQFQEIMSGGGGAEAPASGMPPLPGGDAIVRPVTGGLRRTAQKLAAEAVEEAPKKRTHSKGFLAVLGVSFVAILAIGFYFMRRDPREVAQMFASPRTKIADPEDILGKGPPTSLGNVKPLSAGGTGGQQPAQSAQGNQAIEFVKKYPLGENRNTIGEWLQYMFPIPQSSKDPWSATMGQDANSYFVEFKLGQPSPGTGEPITYVFGVDIAKSTVVGLNPQAQALLARPAAPAAPAAQTPQTQSQPPARFETPKLSMPKAKAASRTKPKAKPAPPKPKAKPKPKARPKPKLRPGEIDLLPLPITKDATPDFGEYRPGEPTYSN
ncbi:MAG: hypothetical protein HY078_11005 [Elusimicrobia bacterium]|nr:hypothetical protein [Elusimicrobiota bacterium]